MSTLPIIFLAVLFGASVPTSVKVTEKDLGRTVVMKVGDVLEVVLKGNPTTGYIWDVASPDRGILKKLGEIEFKPDRPARGAGGNMILRFETAKAGEALLNLIYHRPFEKNKPPIRTFEVTIIVK
jgi:inhibitor of cysteine peptidase